MTRIREIAQPTLMPVRKAARLTLLADSCRAFNIQEGDFLEAQVLEGGMLLRPVAMVEHDKKLCMPLHGLKTGSPIQTKTLLQGGRIFAIFAMDQNRMKRYAKAMRLIGFLLLRAAPAAAEQPSVSADPAQLITGRGDCASEHIASRHWVTMYGA
jgi:hypothetical protein